MHKLISMKKVIELLTKSKLGSFKWKKKGTEISTHKLLALGNDKCMIVDV